MCWNGLIDVFTQSQSALSSVTTQLVYIIDQWFKYLAKKQRTMAVFVDFREALDKVCHSGLLYKLPACGVDGTSTRLIKDYLTNRLITVLVGEVISDRQVITGCSSGFPFGPNFISDFINDLKPLHTLRFMPTIRCCG